jgi:hypothetical protein
MKRFAKLCAVLIVSAASWAEGATLRPATCGRNDLANAINSANDGDTIVIPAGTCTWTTSLTISNKAITIQGSGVDVTTIIDGTPKGLDVTESQMLTWSLKASGQHRLTGLTLDGGFGPAEPYNVGQLKILGTDTVNFRMDHFKLITRRTAGIMFYDVLGVIDHGEFILSNAGVPGGNKPGMYVFHGSWKAVGGYGDNSWAQPTNFGTDQFLFVEDSSFSSDPNSSFGLQHSYAVDGWSGQRVVYRNNRFINATWANHGTESGARLRGARAAEIYNNTFTMNSSNVVISSAIGSRGGAALIFNNELTLSGGAYITNFIDLAVLRANQAYFPWGKCDGSSIWDQVSGGTAMHCLDQPGVGQGLLLTGDTASPAGWPQQATDANYIWGNTRSGAVLDADVMPRNAQSQEGRDFLKSAKPGYTPFAYPHPLTGGSVAPAPATGPTPPSNVRIVS